MLKDIKINKLLIKDLIKRKYRTRLSVIFPDDAHVMMASLKAGVPAEVVFEGTSMLWYKGFNSTIDFLVKELDDGINYIEFLNMIEDYRERLATMHKGQRNWKVDLSYRAGNWGALMTAKNSAQRIYSEQAAIYKHNHGIKYEWRG